MLNRISRIEKKFSQKRRPLLMAHRGNRALFPENTLAAFKQAIDDNADILETDLHLSADDIFICIHDSSVNRTTHGSGEVKNLSLKEIKTLRTLDSNQKPTTYQVPTLEETLKMLPANMVLALELKTDRFLEPKICQRLGNLLQANHALDRTIVISFSLERLKTMQKFVSEIPIGWISMKRLLPDKDVDLIGAFWPVFFLNPWYVQSAHKNGMFVCPLDPTPEPRLKYYLRKNVDAILSDNPQKTRMILDQLISF